MAGTGTLTWASKDEWGHDSKTYRAQANGWKYHIGQVSGSGWVLRGWGPDDKFLYRAFRTLKDAKIDADQHNHIAV